MQNHETVMSECRTCTRVTEHVRRVKRDPSRSHEQPKPARDVLQCIECGWVTETLPSNMRSSNI